MPRCNECLRSEHNHHYACPNREIREEVERYILCEKCRTRIAEHDYAYELPRHGQTRVYCEECAEEWLAYQMHEVNDKNYDLEESE